MNEQQNKELLKTLEKISQALISIDVSLTDIKDVMMNEYDS